MGTNKLTDAQVRAAKPKATLYKLTDGNSMYLAVLPSGSKVWRMKYRRKDTDGFKTKETIYTIGPYPEYSLAEARAKREAIRKSLHENLDPHVERKKAEAQATISTANTFGAVGQEWLDVQTFSSGHRAATLIRLEQDLSDLAALPIADVGAEVILATLRKIEARPAYETRDKCRRLIGQVLDYAIATGKRKDPANPADSIRRALKKAPKEQSQPTVAASEMPKFFKAIRATSGESTPRLCLYWCALTACRSVEGRLATWGEIDGDWWRVPADRMKMRRGHAVPLSAQAKLVLKLAAKERTGNRPEDLLFPGYSSSGLLSENAMLALIRRAGYLKKQTTHGFRAAFSTWANEQGYPTNHIEACLAHTKGGTEGAYNRATYDKQRAPLMQKWADQLAEWGLDVRK